MHFVMHNNRPMMKLFVVVLVFCSNATYLFLFLSMFLLLLLLLLISFGLFSPCDSMQSMPVNVRATNIAFHLRTCFSKHIWYKLLMVILFAICESAAIWLRKLRRSLSLRYHAAVIIINGISVFKWFFIFRSFSFATNGKILNPEKFAWKKHSKEMENIHDVVTQIKALDQNEKKKKKKKHVSRNRLSLHVGPTYIFYI